MFLIPIFVLILLALSAAGFVCLPVVKAGGTLRARLLLATAIAAVVIGIGGGCYLMLGAPKLAARSFSQPSPNDLPGLVSLLAQRVRERPQDPRGWTLLGRGYLTVGDPVDAAAAFKRGILVSAPPERPPLYSAYGESLTIAAQGTVTDEAENAFRAALAENPRDFASRYYLGLAYASRRDVPHALALWQSLLAEAPADAPWRADLVDRIAALTSATGAAPNVAQMVASLAERLRRQPQDFDGWQRLIRAYTVMGRLTDAKGTLAEARRTFRSDKGLQARLAAEAKSLGID